MNSKNITCILIPGYWEKYCSQIQIFSPRVWEKEQTKDIKGQDTERYELENKPNWNCKMATCSSQTSFTFSEETRFSKRRVVAVWKQREESICKERGYVMRRMHGAKYRVEKRRAFMAARTIKRRLRLVPIVRRAVFGKRSTETR